MKVKRLQTRSKKFLRMQLDQKNDLFASGVERRWAIFVKGRHQKYSKKKQYMSSLDDDK